jgi:hypothetical protein
MLGVAHLAFPLNELVQSSQTIEDMVTCVLRNIFLQQAIQPLGKLLRVEQLIMGWLRDFRVDSVCDALLLDLVVPGV